MTDLQCVAVGFILVLFFFVIFLIDKFSYINKEIETENKVQEAMENEPT